MIDDRILLNSRKSAMENNEGIHELDLPSINEDQSMNQFNICCEQYQLHEKSKTRYHHSFVGWISNDRVLCIECYQIFDQISS